MKIIIRDELGESRVDDAVVSSLPEPLRDLTVGLLSKLKGVKTVTVEDLGSISEAILELSEEKNVSIDHFSTVGEEFLDVIDLLMWYEGPKWYKLGSSETVGGYVYCKGCDYSRPAGGSERCSEPGCPSHDKWERVGSAYKRPA